MIQNDPVHGRSRGSSRADSSVFIYHPYLHFNNSYDDDAWRERRFLLKYIVAMIYNVTPKKMNEVALLVAIFGHSVGPILRARSKGYIVTLEGSSLCLTTVNSFGEKTP